MVVNHLCVWFVSMQVITGHLTNLVLYAVIKQGEI